LKKALRSISEEIAHNLIQDLRDDESEEAPDPDQASEDMPGQEAQPLVQKPNAVPMKNGEAGAALEERFAKLERRFERFEQRLLAALQDDGKANFPNLKYRKPKYQNVESLLNYVESKDDDGGFKLVIMNFND
jgi:hypothetical protein